jgi:maltose O-acetyltransferase
MSAESSDCVAGDEGVPAPSRVRRATSGVRAILYQELAPVRPWERASSAVIKLLPSVAFIRTRTRLLRLVGWNIGPGAAIFGVPRLYGLGPIRTRLTIGARVTMNVDCTIELNDHVFIGDDVALGQEVKILTGSHDLGGSDKRAGSLMSKPVRIGQGAWIGSGATVLPGVTIGDGAVVMAGSVVNSDVQPSSLVAGVPAVVVVKRLPG